MKRIFALILVFVLCVSLFSCSEKKSAEGDTTATETDKTTDTTAIDGLEVSPGTFDGVSNDRYSDEQLLHFAHSEGEAVLENEYMAVFNNDGSLKITPFYSEEGDEYSNAAAPFGIKVGDSAADFVEAYSIDPQFAIFVDSTGYSHEFANGETVEVPDDGSGSIYLGFGKDGDEWAFMDYQMLKSVILGNAIIMGADEFPVILFSCKLDGNENIVEMYEFYGDVNVVMSYIAG